jgi:hypothetical protein
MDEYTVAPDCEGSSVLSLQPITNGSAVSSGDYSPAVSGDGNVVNYGSRKKNPKNQDRNKK